VEGVVKIMKTLPKCHTLQKCACGALRNVISRNVTGKKEAIESGVIEVVLAAMNNHLDSAKLCEHTCCALYNIVTNSKENTGLLISLGGRTTVAKVRKEWLDNNDIQTQMQKLADLIAFGY
jgi:hypothetical protein